MQGGESFMRRTKRTVIEEELEGRIASGILEDGSEFPGARQLTRLYGISQRTASVIIRDLGRKGLLKTSRGRRSRVSSVPARKIPLHFERPVGLIGAASEVVSIPSWRSWLFRRLRKKLSEAGIPCSPVSANAVPKKAVRTFSGIILAGEWIQPPFWESVEESGLPCARISFCRPHPDSVFVDYRPAMDRLALFLAGKECRRLVLLTSSEREFQYSASWFGEIGFMESMEDYRIGEQGIMRMAFHPELPEDAERLRKFVGTNRVRTGYLTCSPEAASAVSGIMSGLRLHPGMDYELVSLCGAPETAIPSHYIDLKCTEVAENLLDLFCLHAGTGKSQLGRIVYAKFCEPGEN